MVERLFKKAFLLNFDDKWIVFFGPLKHIGMYSYILAKNYYVHTVLRHGVDKFTISLFQA